MKHQTLEHEGITYHFQQTHEWHNLKVIKVNLPDSVKGMVAPWGEDEHRIFINSKLPEDKQKETFVHEMLHLYRGDLSRIGEDVKLIEEECDQDTDRIIRKMKGDIEI